jgi:hypothetical protein
VPEPDPPADPETAPSAADAGEAAGRLRAARQLRDFLIGEPQADAASRGKSGGPR